MVHQYSHTESSPPPSPSKPHKDHLLTTNTSVHMSDRCARSNVSLSPLACWARHIQTKTAGPFCLFSFYPLYLNSKQSFLLVGVCILHMSALSVLWTLLFLNLDFTDLSGVLYYMWGGRERGGVPSSSLGETNSPTSFKVPKMQLHSLDDEVAYDGVNAVLTHLVCPILAVFTRSINPFVGG